mmetsp:Transcript_3010/g.8917  ORF Transcript_3010/g.8917 Transcript_3010/m.8917 type:complete len:214 (+) Transcript_3010:2375-3016(+)
MTSTGSRAKVRAASQMSTTSGELTCTMKTSQKYANIEKAAVTKNTGVSLIFRVSGLGMANMHTAMMTKRLKAAEPTIVDGPSTPMWKSFLRASTVESRISGAEDPSASNVRLATVPFQTATVTVRPVCFSCTRRFLLVMTSMEPTNLSATMLTPRKRYTIAAMYSTTRMPSGHWCSASKRGKNWPFPPGSQMRGPSGGIRARPRGPRRGCRAA